MDFTIYSRHQSRLVNSISFLVLPGSEKGIKKINPMSEGRSVPEWPCFKFLYA